MSPQTAYSPAAYRQGAVLSATPGQQIVMLYDGARRFLHQAAVAMGERKIEAAHNKLVRAENIIRHLRNTLDLEQGELAVRLQSIYMFCLHHLSQGRFDQDPKKLEEVSALLSQLREAWVAIEGHEHS
jgi:flagellar protein FliS